jgi:hypothetical protein
MGDPKQKYVPRLKQRIIANEKLDEITWNWWEKCNNGYVVSGGYPEEYEKEKWFLTRKNYGFYCFHGNQNGLLSVTEEEF